MKIKVLVIEDQPSLNRSMVNMLRKEGYEAYGSLDITDAKETFVQKAPDIVLLDVMLPQGYGYELIHFFRRRQNSHIIMLTALGDDKSKRVCYESGADDYITKPFDMHELLYKLRAISRRVHLEQSEYQVGDIQVNTITNRLACNGKAISVQPSQVRLLTLLFHKYLEEDYVSKDEAFEEACQEVNDTGRLQTLVARLRKNLGYVGSKQLDIETLYGKGYRLTVESVIKEG